MNNVKGRKMKKIIIIVILVVLIAIMLCFCIRLYGLSKRTPYISNQGIETDTENEMVMPEDMSQVVKGKLIYLCNTQKEAENIAALYDIELTSFGDGVAVYHTDRDIDEIIEEGKKQGYPELHRDVIRTTH